MFENNTDVYEKLKNLLLIIYIYIGDIIKPSCKKSFDACQMYKSLSKKPGHKLISLKIITDLKYIC